MISLKLTQMSLSKQQMNKDIEMENICNTNTNNKNEVARKFTRAELRVKNDIMEFQTKRTTTGKYEVTLSNYIISETGNECVINVEFKNYFVICIVFGKEYPFEPPDITYVSGSNEDIMDMFDIEMKLKLPLLQKSEWKPILSLNSILFSIELLLINKESYVTSITDSENEMEMVYSKRKMRDYSEYNSKLNTLIEEDENMDENVEESNQQYILYQMENLKMKNDAVYKH